MTRALITQMLEALEQTVPLMDKAFSFDDGDVFGKLHNAAVDSGLATEQAILVAREYLAVPEQSEPEGAPYGIIDPDYARVYTQARIVAWQYGYACVMHGSFTRDLDLLLVPWENHAAGNDEQLLKLIAQSCGLRFSDGKENVVYSTVDFTDKPHGRKSCSLYFPAFGDRRWIDISVVPRVTAPQPTAPQPTTPEPVNQMLLEALKKIAMVNAMDYEYQSWAYEAIAAAEQAPQPAELSDAELATVASTSIGYDGNGFQTVHSGDLRYFARAVLAKRDGK